MQVRKDLPLQRAGEFRGIGEKSKVMGSCIASMKDIEENSSICPTEQLLDVFLHLLPFFFMLSLQV